MVVVYRMGPLHRFLLHFHGLEMYTHTHTHTQDMLHTYMTCMRHTRSRLISLTFISGQIERGSSFDIDLELSFQTKTELGCLFSFCVLTFGGNFIASFSICVCGLGVMIPTKDLIQETATLIVVLKESGQVIKQIFGRVRLCVCVCVKNM